MVVSARTGRARRRPGSPGASARGLPGYCPADDLVPSPSPTRATVMTRISAWEVRRCVFPNDPVPVDEKGNMNDRRPSGSLLTGRALSRPES